MPVKAQCNAGHLGQRVHGTPGAALALGVAEHAVCTFVRATVRAVLAGKGSVRADGFDHALPAVRPVVSFDQSHAVGTDFLFRNVITVPGGTAGTIVRRILLRLAGAQIFSAFIDDGAVPVGLTYHLFTERNEVLIGKRRIDSFAHFCSSSCVSSFFSSVRPCSCASTSFILSGMGRPMWAAFSSRDSPSLDR